MSFRFSFAFALCAALLIAAAAPVRAEAIPSCYTPTEAEAEQGIRIHSELMVIGLNCQHMTPKGWKNFYAQYREITGRNAALISGYENTLVSWFARNGAANPDRAVHDMRTRFANEVSTEAAHMRPDIFCANYAPRLPLVDKMSPAQLRQWAASPSNQQKLTMPMCR